MGININWGETKGELGWLEKSSERRLSIDMKAVVAELVAMTLFVVFGCGIACGNGAGDASQRVIVAFAFGMSIMVLAYTIGHHSGGQINCAVTLTLVLGGQVHWLQGLANFLAQMLGSVLGALILCMIFTCDTDMTLALGSNAVGAQYGVGNAIVAEIMGTFLLCYVVWETAVSPLSAAGQNACIAIGFAVFLAHLFLLPITGCSINPTRSFGPAIVSKIVGCDTLPAKALDDLWVFWVGPLIGAGLAAAAQVPMVHFFRNASNDAYKP